MSIGSLRALVTSLTTSASLVAAGATVVFGEEPQSGWSAALPLVVVMPTGGPWTMNGYAVGDDPDVGPNPMWMTNESIDIYMWAVSPTFVPGQTELSMQIDNAEAVEDLRAAVLQALQAQQDSGFKYAPLNGRWYRSAGAMSRFGRAYVLTVQVDITVPGVQPVDATVTSVTLNQSI